MSLASVGSAHGVSAALGLNRSQTVCFPGLHFSGSRLLCPSRATVCSGRNCLRNCLRQALDCVHFPGLSRSGSRVLHRGADSAGPAFCALPRSEQLRWPGAWQGHSPKCMVHLNHLPGPSHLVSWVCSGSAVSDVPCVSSGELISHCGPPGGCQPSRIPGLLGWQLGACLQFGGGCHLWGGDCPLPSGSGCHLPASLPLAGDGLVCCRLALLWYSLSCLFCEWAGSVLD